MIAVKHNIEVAHRLSERPGKCENIHGHSMWVTLSIEGERDEHGFEGGLDFAEVKREFRDYLDTNYDHHLLLNAADVWAQAIWRVDQALDTPDSGAAVTLVAAEQVAKTLPGLVTFDGDPTTEKIAEDIFRAMQKRFDRRPQHPPLLLSSAVSSVEVWETSVNMARFP
jgi:6-pyruvoyl-tetrahydropterin synthase